MLFHSTVLFERAPSQSLSEEDGMSGERCQQEAAWQNCVWMLRTGETDLRIPRRQLSEESSVVMVGNVFNVFTTWQDAASIQSGWTVPASAKSARWMLLRAGCSCGEEATASWWGSTTAHWRPAAAARFTSSMEDTVNLHDLPHESGDVLVCSTLHHSFHSCRSSGPEGAQ